jgi:transcriptional regulator with XRE-family HTH domain
VERIVIDELRRLALGPERVAALAGEAQQAYEATLKPLIARRAQASAELERIAGRLSALLELAEDRLVTKQEYAARRARLEAQKAALESELPTLEDDIAARAATSIDPEATMRSLRRLGDVFDALDDVIDRRRLLATCLSRVVVRQGALELHVPAVPLLVGSRKGAERPPRVSSFGKSGAAGTPESGAQNGQNGAEFPWLGSGAISENYGIRERMGAHSFANTIVPSERDREAQPGRELVLTVPLPEDRGRRGDGRPRVHRFRSQQLELGVRLRAFRERYGLTQVEVARVLGVTKPAVCQWEAGVAVAKGLPRERLRDLLEGRLWPELRTALIAGEGLPRTWRQAARWYRRASRERRHRQTVGVILAAMLDGLAAVGSPEALGWHYVERDGEWAHGMTDRSGYGQQCHTEVRRIEDAAYGMRWLELARELRLDLSWSLVPQLPRSLFSEDD